MADVPWWQILLGMEAPQSNVLCVVLILAGMALITKGGDLFTDSAVAIARATRIPPVIIGATIVSVATTFPEYMVSLTSVLQEQPEFAVGNALGSCCCNIGLIVGTCAILKGILAKKRNEEAGIPVNRVTLLGPGLFMLTAGFAVWCFSMFDNAGLMNEKGDLVPYALSRWQGAVLAVLLVIYLGYSLRTALKARFETTMTEEGTEVEQEIREQIGKQFVMFVLGAFLVVLGSRLMVASAAHLAGEFGVPELIVGLTVLAIGTSLPEYTISLMAVIKGHGSLGIGNIIGANVLNICWVVATCSLIKPLPIQPQTIILDGPVMLLLMITMLALGWRRERISMSDGVVLCSIFAVYYVIMFSVFIDH
ncbi:MAG: calcium/sodium antiporter [Planctomycetes bacterium]|nr:calcium/sodium antiporter [Planctomycetota bacterium]